MVADVDQDHDSSGSSLEVDSSDQDSALGDSGPGSGYSTSVSSSIYQYRYENGRRYHAYQEGKYPMPNDEEEKDRLDLQHHAFRLTADGLLHIAPLPKTVQNVLDIGTGTGIWAIEFAEEHPEANVVGTDLSPIQPSFVPPNCSFLIDDVDRDWTFDVLFDYVHARAMIFAMKDWKRFMSQAFANLKPGGYLEIQEFYTPLRCFDEPDLDSSESAYLQWTHLMAEASGKVGLDLTAAASFREPLRAAGFVDIHAKHYKWPVGTWAKGAKYKLLGKFAREDILDLLSSSSLALLTRVMKWTREEVEVLLANVRNDLKFGKHLFYSPLVFWYARKPTEEDLVGNEQAQVEDDVVLEADNSAQMNIQAAAKAQEGGGQIGPTTSNESQIIPSDPYSAAGESSTMVSKTEPDTSATMADAPDVLRGPMSVTAPNRETASDSVEDTIGAGVEKQGSLDGAPELSSAKAPEIHDTFARSSDEPHEIYISEPLEHEITPASMLQEVSLRPEPKSSIERPSPVADDGHLDSEAGEGRATDGKDGRRP